MKSHTTKQGFNSDEYETPSNLFKEIRKTYPFLNLDLACTKENELIPGSWNIHQGKVFSHNWINNKYQVYCNPPYSELRRWLQFLDKGYFSLAVALVPLRTLTAKYFHELNHVRAIYIIKSRVNFNYKGEQIKGNIAGHCILEFDPDIDTYMQTEVAFW